MLITLTDAQVVVLNWDRKLPIKTTKRGRTFDVPAEELAMMRDVAESQSWGADPGTISAAKALTRKLNKAKCKADLQPHAERNVTL